MRSRHFYAAEVRRHLIKSPVEFTAGLVRVLALPRDQIDLVTLTEPCHRQGQNLFYPPNVKGWDGGRAWVSTQPCWRDPTGLAISSGATVRLQLCPSIPALGESPPDRAGKYH